MTSALDQVAALELPKRLAAREPVERFYGARDAVRLLVSSRGGEAPQHRGFIDLPALLEPRDLLVANDSATLAACVFATAATGERVVVHLATCVAQHLWIVEPREALANGRIPLTEERRTELRGRRFTLAEGIALEFLSPVHASSTRLWYATIGLPRDYAAYLARFGTPIRYDYVNDIFPLADYQTIFARVPGSAEMPSAGRPFTQTTLAGLRERGIDLATITLHTGVSSPEAHEPPMAEWYAVPDETVRAIERTRARNGCVIAIGTTVVRALESAARTGKLHASDGWTDHVIDRANPPRVVNGILTGLHEPRASHLAMLEAFLPPEFLADAYREGIAHGYLWHEFGDVHLIA